MSGFLGILMLDTRFERIIGDAGNPQSYPVEARCHVIPGAGSVEIVRDGRPAEALVQGFIKAARQLEAEGARALVSTCGFLVTVQADIAQAVRIPVCLSALTLLPAIRAMQGGRRIGILTASRPSLGPAALSAAGVSQDGLLIAGMEGCEAFVASFLRPFDQQAQVLDRAAVAAGAVEAARSLMAAAPDLGAIVLECGNLPPYADAIAKATGRPVYSILDAARLMLASR
jgi:Asp/Glu/hydantoin racemase